MNSISCYEGFNIELISEEKISIEKFLTNIEIAFNDWKKANESSEKLNEYEIYYNEIREKLLLMIEKLAERQVAALLAKLLLTKIFADIKAKESKNVKTEEQFSSNLEKYRYFLNEAKRTICPVKINHKLRNQVIKLHQTKPDRRSWTDEDNALIELVNYSSKKRNEFYKVKEHEQSNTKIKLYENLLSDAKDTDGKLSLSNDIKSKYEKLVCNKSHDEWNSEDFALSNYVQYVWKRQRKFYSQSSWMNIKIKIDT